MFNVPAWSNVANPFYCQYRDGQRLLITVGDSWTYGDSLGDTKVRLGKDDTDYRLSHVYGNAMSKHLGCDWINLALPGISNFCMLNWLAELLSVKSQYDRVDCVITLTESGRHEELYYLNKKISLQHNLENIVSKTYGWIAELERKHPQVHFLIAHNFTDSIKNDKNNICDKSWLEVLTDLRIQNGTHVVVSEHISQMNYQHEYDDRLNIVDKALARIDIMDGCQYCNHEDSRHPNEQGHELWAKYLLDEIC